MITEAQIRHVASTTPLWYDTIALLAECAERAGMNDAAFLTLVAGACGMAGDNRGIGRAIDAGIAAWRKKGAGDDTGNPDG